MVIKMAYLLIFFLKILENTLATLRIIVLANGKKYIGAILNFIISLTWVISTGLVIINLKEEPFKIIAFSLGSFIGSYLGSYIEEKIAIGNNLLFIISKANISKKLKQLNYKFNKINKYIYLILIERKHRNNLLKNIKKIDNEIIIYSHLTRNINLNKIKMDNP